MNRLSTKNADLPRPLIPPTHQGPVGSAGPTGGFVRRSQSAGGPPATHSNAPLSGGEVTSAAHRSGEIAHGAGVDAIRRRGRGAVSNASGRYEPVARVAFDDGWQNLEDLPP